MKFGTQTLVDSKKSISGEAISAIANASKKLIASGTKPLIVTSGAIGLGLQRLTLEPPLSVVEKQTAASVGQGLLMRLYDQAFSKESLLCGQVLLTAQDLASRRSFLNLKEALEKLLELNVVPIINENDLTSIAEITENEQHSFGDNDSLSAIVSTKTNSELLAIFTDVDGIYTKNPKHHADASRLKVIKDINSLLKVDSEGKSDLGRGGMASKINAAKTAALCGVPVLIASIDKLKDFSEKLNASSVEELSELGTVVLPVGGLRGKKKWIGTATGFRAVVTINEGAKNALLKKNASLLSVGISSVNGEFSAGDTLSIRDELGNELARGIAKIGNSEVTKEKGSVLIHRDNLAVLYTGE